MATAPPYGRPAVRLPYNQYREDMYGHRQDPSLSGQTLDPYIQRAMGLDTTYGGGNATTPGMPQDYSSPVATTNPPVTHNKGFLSKAVSYIRAHPRETQGFVGSIMNIPQGGGFLEGLQGGLGGYNQGVSNYNAMMKKRQDEIDADALKNRQVGAQEMTAAAAMKRAETVRSAARSTLSPTDIADRQRAALQGRLDFNKTLTPEEYMNLYHVPPGGRQAGAHVTDATALAADLSRNYNISPEDARILAHYAPIKTQDSQDATDFPKPGMPGYAPGRGWIVTHHKLAPTWQAHPMAAAVLQKYKLDPNAFYNSPTYQQHVDQTPAPDATTGPDTTGGGSDVTDLIYKSNEDQLKQLWLAPDTSDEEKGAILDQLGILGKDPNGITSDWEAEAAGAGTSAPATPPRR